MIEIGTPYVTEENGTAYLKAPVRISRDTALRYLEETGKLVNCGWLTAVDYPPAVWQDTESCLWFSVSAEYGKYLCPERSNAFVIAMLWYAMLTGSDIRFEAPMSKRLYEGLTKELIPALTPERRPSIRLMGTLTDEPVSGGNGVVAGMTGGVDSLYTLHCYGSDDAPDGMRLTHLAYYDLTRYFPFLQPPYDVNAVLKEQSQLFEPLIESCRRIAEGRKLPLVVMYSNLDNDYYRGGLVYTGMYRFLACTLAMERLYRVYIDSSSGETSEREAPSLLKPTQRYEKLICKACRTESLRYVVSDDVPRTKKIEAIADDPDAQRSLSVCFNIGERDKNCGRCYGCMKTMIPLDLLGKLTFFDRAFDLEEYEKNKHEVFEELIRYSRRPEAEAARTTVRQLLDLAKNRPSASGELFLEAYNLFAV